MQNLRLHHQLARIKDGSERVNRGAAAERAPLHSTHLTMTAGYQQDQVWKVYGVLAANDQSMGFHMMDGDQREGVLFAKSFRVFQADLS